MDLFHLREAFNARLRILEAPVSVLEIEEVSDEFHARFSAVGRGYIYRILNRRAPTVLEANRVWTVGYPLDVDKMREGAKYLLGNHNFSSFRGAGCQAMSPIKTLDKLDIIKDGDEIKFIVEARSFLYHQVRNIVGTLKSVGDGKLNPEDVKTILDANGFNVTDTFVRNELAMYDTTYYVYVLSQPATASMTYTFSYS